MRAYVWSYRCTYIHIYKYRCFYYNQYKNYRGNYLIDLVLWTRERLAKPAGVRIVYCSGDARENMIWSSCQIKMVCNCSIPCHVSWGCFYISIPFVSYMHPIIRCLYEQDYCHHALHITQNQIYKLKVMALSVYGAFRMCRHWSGCNSCILHIHESNLCMNGSCCQANEIWSTKFLKIWVPRQDCCFIWCSLSVCKYP